MKRFTYFAFLYSVCHKPHTKLMFVGGSLVIIHVNAPSTYYSPHQAKVTRRGIEPPVFAVKGRCLSRLTTGPYQEERLLNFSPFPISYIENIFSLLNEDTYIIVQFPQQTRFFLRGYLLKSICFSFSTTPNKLWSKFRALLVLLYPLWGWVLPAKRKLMYYQQLFSYHICELQS